MYRNDKQGCVAIRLLLASLGMEGLWTETGPTSTAVKYLEGSPLSSGEQLLLRAAFDLWNGHGKVTLWDLMGTLDATRTELLFSLALAVTNGGHAVDTWIEQRKEIVEA